MNDRTYLYSLMTSFTSFWSLGAILVSKGRDWLCSFLYLACPTICPLLYWLLLLGAGFESLPHFYMWCAVHSHGQIESHGVNVTQLTHPFMDWWTFGSFLLFVTWIQLFWRYCACFLVSLAQHICGVYSYKWNCWVLGWNSDHGIRSHHFVANRWGNNGNGERLYFSGLQNLSRCWLQPWN